MMKSLLLVPQRVFFQSRTWLFFPVFCFLLFFQQTVKADIKPATTPRHIYKFYVGSFDESTPPYQEQILLSGETLLPPPMPVNQSPGYVFTGWYNASADFDAPSIEFSDPVEIKEDKTIRLQARFSNRVYVHFIVESALNVEGETASSLRVIATEELNKDATVTIDSIPIIYPSGKIFGHWSKEIGGSAFDLNSEIGENTSLYLVYKDGYRVSFRMRGGTGILPKYYISGDQLDPTNAIQKFRSGYTFKGWCTTDPDELSPLENYDDLTPNFDSSDPVLANLVLYALWAKNDDTLYNVIYLIQNADDDGYTVKYVLPLAGKTESEALYNDISYDPALTGFELNLEKTNSNTPLIDGFGTTIKRVYYDRKKFPLRFIRSIAEYDGQVSDYLVKDYVNLKFGQRLNEQWNEVQIMPINEFTIWAVNPIISNKGELVGIDKFYTNVPTMPLGGLDVYAYDGGNTSAKVRYLEKFQDGTIGTKELIPDFSHLSRGNIIVLTKEDGIKIEGFEFNMEDFHLDPQGGWYKPYVEDDNGLLTGTLLYTRRSYPIRFDMRLGETAIFDTEPIPYQDDISYFQTVKIGGAFFKKGVTTVEKLDGNTYVFQGWFTAESFVPDSEFDFGAQTMPAKPLILYAKWAPPIHTVFLHTSTDKKSSVYKEFKFEHNSFISPVQIAEMKNSVPNDQENFFQWFWYKDGQFARYDIHDPIIADVHLYPVWRNKGCRVEYTANGASGEVPTDANIYIIGTPAIVRDIATLTAPAGKVFVGWKSDIENDKKLYAPGDKLSVIKDPVKLTAQWEKLPKVASITYNSNGGVGDDIVNTLAENAKHTVLENTVFTRPTYEFFNWNTAADGKGVPYSPLDEIIVSKNSSGTNTLFAQWRKVIDVTAKVIWKNVPDTEEHPTVHFALFRKIEDGDEEPVGDRKILPDGTESVTWPGLKETDESGKPYIYYVKQVDESWNDYTPEGFTKEEQGLTVTNTKNSGTAVKNANLKSKIIYYPNPVLDRLFIETEQKIESIELYSLIGNKLLSVTWIEKNQALLEVDFSQIESGVYFVKLLKKEGFEVLKIIKN